MAVGTLPLGAQESLIYKDVSVDAAVFCTEEPVWQGDAGELERPGLPG